ncbi:MAG: hypothetical protein Q9197_006231 [Variospora fuerteventurae]
MDRKETGTTGHQHETKQGTGFSVVLLNGFEKVDESLKIPSDPNLQTFNMQFKNIVAFVSLAVMATALPADNIVRRTDSEDAAQQCSANQSGTLKCCNTVTNTFFGLLGSLPIGNGCELISVLDVLSNQCEQNQEVACCKSGDQVGLINLGLQVCQVL